MVKNEMNSGKENSANESLEKVRDSFVFHHLFWESLIGLGDEHQTFIFFTAICNYAFERKVPTWEDGKDKVIWNMLKVQLDKDADKYAETCRRNAENARKGWMKAKCQTMPKMPVAANGMPEEAKNADYDNDYDNENDNHCDSFNERKKKFREKVFSVKGYSKHHLETFVEYYSMPATDEPGKMFFETYKAFSLPVYLKKWREPALPANPMPMTVESAADRQKKNQKDFEAERQRLSEFVEAYKKDPNFPRASMVEEWSKNGMLAKYGLSIEENYQGQDNREN